RRPGNEPAQGKDAPQGPGIAEPEDDVSLPKHAPGPAAPPGHRRGHGQGRELSGQPGPARGRAPEIARPGGRSQPAGRFLRPPPRGRQRDHPAAEPRHRTSPGTTWGVRARASCTVPDVVSARGDLRTGNGFGRAEGVLRSLMLEFYPTAAITMGDDHFS